jgi:sulfate permease, SulP family
VANVSSGLAGGMGGCAMIGQTMINLNSGGRGRVSGVVAGVMVLLFVLVLSPLIEQIPLAALVGVMFVVAQQTFAWGSLRVFNKVPRQDAIVIVLVTVVTVLTDLAVAVVCGVIIAALSFAWQHARELYADAHDEADGSKLYRVHGTLFFASTTAFLNLFDAAGDPPQVTLDCRHLSFVDYSAIEALHTLRQRYQRAGKHLRVVHLSERCKQLLRRAGAHD